MEINRTEEQRINELKANIDDGNRDINELEQNRIAGRTVYDTFSVQELLERNAEVEMANSRMMAKALQDSVKTFGDSKLMKAVKSSVARVSEDIEQTRAEEFTEEDFTRITGDYFQAINSCREYLRERSSSEGKGGERRMAVQKNLDRLMSEVELLGLTREYYNAGVLVGDPVGLCLKDLYIRARVYDLSTSQGNFVSSEKEVTETITDPAILKIRSYLEPPKGELQGDKAKEYAAVIMELKRTFMGMQEDMPLSVYREIAGEQVLFSRDADGCVTITSGSSSAVIKESVNDIIRLLDLRILEESEIMNASDVEEVVRQQKEYRIFGEEDESVGQKNVGDIQRAGSRLARFLEIRTGKSATFFSNLSVSQLRMLSLMLVQGNVSVEDVIKTTESIEKGEETGKVKINTSETLELLKNDEVDVDEDLGETVTYEHEEDDAEAEDGWEDDERKIRDLIADMIFSQDTWESDESIAQPGERMRRMLLKNKEAVAILISDNYREDQDAPSVLDRVLDKLPLDLISKKANEADDEEEINAGSIKAAFKRSVEQFNKTIENQINNATEDASLFIGEEEAEDYRDVFEEQKSDKDAVEALLEKILNTGNETQKELLNDELKEMEEQMDGLMVECSRGVQLMIERSLQDVFSNRNAGNNDPQALARRIEELNPKAHGLDPDQRQERIKQGEEELKKILTDSLKGDSGQGKFIKVTFENYFKLVNNQDKRSMFGSAIRGAKANQNAGQFLGGLLKGAGPLFQKMMQGLPTEGFPEDIQVALSDMKSKLAPIPDRIVKAQLLGMVERSDGRITGIEVTKALGAASVGQTFLCRMYGPNLPIDGKDVVVKLLKPDVRNRMMREKDIMLKCAQMTDKTGGMEATYLGQLSRIEEELDLTIEARNVGRGAVYDKVEEGKEDDHVRAMKLDSLVEPTINAMVLEKAPGTTVDRYLKDLKAKIASLDELVKQREEEVLPKYMARPREDKTLSKEENNKRFEAYRKYEEEHDRKTQAYKKRLFEEYKNYRKEIVSAIKRQKYLTALADKWVSEGIYGEGFYHGDLHAGNIMINDDGLTVIDFGNATTLDENQQVQVTRMVGASAVGDVDGFMDGLHMLLKPEFESQFKKVQNSLAREMKNIFTLGNKNSAGMRIAVGLLKAQELGLEVPSAIFNFSQCQLRLQNAIDELNQQIKELKKGMFKFDENIHLCASSNMDLYDNIIISLAMDIRDIADDEPDKSAKERFRQGAEHFMDKFDVENSVIDEKCVYDGTLLANLERYQDENKKLVFDVGRENFAGTMMAIFTQLKQLKQPPKDKDYTQWKAMVGIALDRFKPFANLDGFKDSVIGYVDKIVETRFDKKDFPNDADVSWVKNVDSQLERISKKVKTALDSCRALEAAKKDKKKTPEEIKQAAEKVKSDYLELEILRAMYLNNEPLRRVMRKLSDPENKENNDELIAKTAELDEELGKKLKDDYAVFLKYQTDNPGMIVHSTVEMENVIRDIMKLEAIRLKDYYDDMNIIANEQVLSFIDVMGDTIVRNLAESFKRLGFWTSYKYNSKLSSEDA